MNVFGHTITNQYEVLGLARSTSTEEIKKAYRRLVRMHHPDMLGTQDVETVKANAIRFDEVQRAYEWLLEHHQDASTSEPAYEPAFNFNSNRFEHTSIDGVDATLFFTEEQYGYPETHLYITLANARVLRAFPEGVRIRKVVVTQDDSFKKVVFSCATYYFDGFESSLREYDKQQSAIPLSEELEALRAEAYKIEAEGRPVAKLWELFIDAQKALATYTYPYAYRPKSLHDVQSMLRAVRKEAERVSRGEYFEVLVDGLMDGSIYHPDIARNLEVIKQVQALSVRSYGFIEPITEQQLRSFYEARVKATGVVRQGIKSYSLLLRLEDYAPAEIVAELDLAPETVTVRNGNRSTEHVVTYDLVTTGEVPVPVGYITVSVNFYQKVAKEYGKPSNFPALNHDIQLMLVVEQQGRVVAVGPDGDELAKKVNKFQKACARGRKVDDVIKDGYGLNGVFETTTTPPWYRGPRIR